MTKFQLTVAAAVVIGLSIGLSLQLTENQHLREELAASHTRIAMVRKARAEIQKQIALKETALQKFDAAIAAQTPPLTPEQQERVRLDTLIRKGELDSEYAPLFRRLRLSPGALDQLKGLIVERNQAIYDALKLAKAEGVEPASPAEFTAIGESATGEVDRRIAMLLGDTGDSQFREFIALQPYRRLTMSLVAPDRNSVTSPLGITADPAFDEQSNTLARLLAKVAPGYLSERYRADGWPPDLPAEFREALSKVVSPEALRRYDYETSLNTVRRRMTEISRAAALQGKLKLSKSSARDYPAPAMNPSSATK